MSRRHRRRRDGARDLSPGGGRGLARVAAWRGGGWVVRPVVGAAATKPYRCPGCDGEIHPATPHVVAWPAYGERAGGGPQERRHWHTSCWGARERRGPRQRR